MASVLHSFIHSTHSFIYSLIPSTLDCNIVCQFHRTLQHVQYFTNTTFIISDNFIYFALISENKYLNINLESTRFLFEKKKKEANQMTHCVAVPHFFQRQFQESAYFRSFSHPDISALRRWKTKGSIKKNTVQIFVRVLNARNATGDWHRLNDTSECQLTGRTLQQVCDGATMTDNDTLLKLKRKLLSQTPLSRGSL
jgi:hypothetical protein